MGIRLFDMVGCLSSAMDLVCPEVVGHHRRVGIIVNELAREAGLPDQTRADLALAGMVHDVGAFSLKDRLASLAFEANDQTHPEIGYRLFSRYPDFSRAASIIRRHHTAWGGRSDGDHDLQGVDSLGNLLCMADRLDTLLPRTPDVPVDRETVRSRIRDGRGRLFSPRWVDVLESLAGRDGFLDKVCGSCVRSACPALPDACNPELSGQDVSGISRLFSQIIDFRCRFTATHSRGVSATAMALASEFGLGGSDRDDLEIAGELHDLGKLGVPSEIILKPASLDPDEMATMQRHALHGFNVIAGTPGLAGVAELVGQHHERLDGKGYPHGVGEPDISLPSRMLAVSDVFTALGEDRPYRPGMGIKQIVSLLEEMAARKSLDGDVVAAVAARQADLDALRREAQSQALKDFERFASGLAP